jgi:hypothetical protein
MGRPGLEPGTNRLKAEYSTIELATLAAAPEKIHFNRAVYNDSMFIFQIAAIAKSFFRGTSQSGERGFLALPPAQAESGVHLY